MRALAVAQTLAITLGALLPILAASPAPAASEREAIIKQQRALRHAPPRVRREYRYCQKLCPNDTNPCDPINFKLSDGRCDFGNAF